MKVCGTPKGFEVPGFDENDWQKAEADHAARLKQHLIDFGHTGPYTGDIISFGVADGSAQYMIVDGSGRYGTRTFLIHLAYGDGYSYNGVQHFPKTKIIEMAKQARGVAKLFQRAVDWWEERELGEIVHYDNGFGEYVRGEIVQTADGKAMKNTALVGNWAKYDLPTRRPDGTINYPHHVRGVIDGKTMKPHQSNMYEYHPGLGKHNHKLIDPRNLTPISFAVPPMTDAVTELARLEKVRQEAVKALNHESGKMPTVASTKRLLQNALKMLEAV